MRSRTGHLLHGTAHRLAVLLLLLAVAVQGCAGVVVQVLGPAHTHSDTVAARHDVVGAATLPSFIAEFLAWREARRQFLLNHGLFKTKPGEPSGHSHDGLQRHHHDAGDTTVLALDGPAAHGSDAVGDAGQQGQTGGLTLPWAPAAEHRLAVPSAVAAGWTAAATARWSSASARLLERPPRTC